MGFGHVRTSLEIADIHGMSHLSMMECPAARAGPVEVSVYKIIKAAGTCFAAAAIALAVAPAAGATTTASVSHHHHGGGGGGGGWGDNDWDGWDGDGGGGDHWGHDGWSDNHRSDDGVGRDSGEEFSDGHGVHWSDHEDNHEWNHRG
jgi:hypothetical protein